MINKLIVKKTQVEMLQDRGYIIPENEQWLLTADTTKKYKNVIYNNYYTKNDAITTLNLDILYVFYIQDDILSDLKTFVKNMQKYDQGLIIGLSREELEKKKYKKLFEEISFKPIQTFEYDDLCYNVTKHIGYNKHEFIDKSLIIPNMVDIDQLSVLRLDDPVCRYFNWQVGDVIKITRQYEDVNLLAQIDIGYRVVKQYL